MTIPLVDLKRQYTTIKLEIDAAVSNVLENTRFIGGQDSKDLESDFARMCNAKRGVGVGSGTSALILALKALDLGPGDEVITVPNTFIATVEAIRRVGAKPVFVEINETSLMDKTKIEDRITDKTKALLPVHLYGQMAEMKGILKIAEENDLRVVEDCAQSHLAEHKGKVCPYGDIGCFSFYPGKNLGAYGDAGMVVTDDDDLAEKVTMLRDHGRKLGDKYIHTIEGSNERLDNLQAAILNVKLKHIGDWTDARRKNAKAYNELLEGVVETPVERPGNKHVYHLYVIRAGDRDKLKSELKTRGISAGIHYPLPLHMQPALSDLGYAEGQFPKTEEYANQVLSLPMFPELGAEEIKNICDSIKNICG